MTAVRVTWKDLPGKDIFWTDGQWRGKTGWIKVWEQLSTVCEDPVLSVYEAEHEAVKAMSSDGSVAEGSCLVEWFEYDTPLALHLCSDLLEAADVVKRLSVFCSLDRPRLVEIVDTGQRAVH